MHPDDGFGAVWATGDGAVGGEFMANVGGAGGVGVAAEYISSEVLKLGTEGVWAGGGEGKEVG